MEREWDAEGSCSGVNHFVPYLFQGIYQSPTRK